MKEGNQKKDKKTRRIEYEEKFKRCSPRYTADEYDELKKKAEGCNNNPTEFVKNVSLNYENKLRSPSKLTLEMKSQVRKMGVNINQIAKQMHLLQYEQDFAKLKEIINDCKVLLNKILEKLNQ